MVGLSSRSLVGLKDVTGPITPHFPIITNGDSVCPVPFRSPLLTVTLVISFPAGTRMFRSPAFPFLTEQSEDYEVALGHRRIIGSLHLPDAIS